MQKLKSSTATIAVLAAIFWLHGFAYEMSAFAVLGLSALKTLSWRHFVYSGFINLAWLFLMFFSFSMLVKFFSKQVDQDDSAELHQIATKMGFHSALKVARGMFLFCLVYWLAVIFEMRFIDTPILGLAFSWILLYTIGAFLLTLLVCPKQALAPVLFAFVSSTMMCLSIGGMETSRLVEARATNDGLVRNDAIVRIERKGNTYAATPNPISFPILVDRALAKLGI